MTDIKIERGTRQPEITVTQQMQTCRYALIYACPVHVRFVFSNPYQNQNQNQNLFMITLLIIIIITRLLVKPSCCSRTAAPCAPFSSRNTRAFYAVELLSMVGLHIPCMCVTPPVTLYLLTHRCTVQRGTRCCLAVARRLPQAFHV